MPEARTSTREIGGAIEGLSRSIGRAIAEAAGPTYRRVYRSVIDAILDGHLSPGSRLPSTRALAAQLGVARGTVETAYQMLTAEGYVTARGAAGTSVSRHLKVGFAAGSTGLRPRPDQEAALDEVAGQAASHNPGPLAMGVPAADAFPFGLWARLVARRARAMEASDVGYPDALGSYRLRRQVVAYLRVARGIECSPAQVLITNGYRGALSLISAALLKPGDQVLVEDPGYPSGREALAVAGVMAFGGPVDEHGLVTDRLPGRQRKTAAVLVTPTHQYPLGHALSVERRADLLAWAAYTGAWVIEDDYDSEFRYTGPPLAALKSLDALGRVVYLGTFSKVLSPGIGAGYLVAPESVVERLRTVAQLLQPPPVGFVQEALADFLEEGHFSRHIKRMRRLYEQRREALRSALAHAGGPLKVVARPGGMHIIGLLEDGTDDVRICGELRTQGLHPSPLSPCGATKPYRPGLLLGFTIVPVEQAEEVSGRLVSALRALGL